ncbi:FG-GAP repeat domain-containing protein [Sphingobacterium sp. HJSM2_6]|uniref:FG-GAP repeat domain-containing protein n=1 Tax=Sphingobacterium sp. HJSM2_6 TaxID=3366264 RepID=UPI003BE7E9B3
MRLTSILFLTLGLIYFAYGQNANSKKPIGPVQFKKVHISSETYESVGAIDVNADGKLDLVSGAFWYEGPDFTKRYFIAEVNRVQEYWDDFSTIVMDVNQDGKMDVVTGGWFEGTLFWLENPGNQGPWKKHVIDKTGNIETARAYDLDGDGIAEIIPNTPGLSLKYYKLNKKQDIANKGYFTKVDVAEKHGHGLGFGDVNGDSRIDIIVQNGWLEAPKNPSDKWVMHADFDFGDASVPMLVTDVNKDGLADLIVGQGHTYGLDWYEQQKDKNGKRIWKKHVIDANNSQYHCLEWEDIDGDGEPELITGKRYRAHNGNDPGANDPYGLYYFKWNGESFTKNIISYGPFGEGKGAGIYFSVADLRNTGRKDIIVAGKDGLCIFFNEGVK